MSEPIRVAMIMGKMIGGGVESVVMNYYRFIDKNIVQFDFIVDEDSKYIPRDEIERLGGRIYEVPPYQNIKPYLSSLKKIYLENNYKIVHSHINALSVFPLYMAKKCGVPIRIAHSHSTASKGEYKKNFVKNLLRPFSRIFPTHFMAPSVHAGKWLFGKKITEEKLMILKNAIDTERFSFNSSSRLVIRDKYGYNNSDVLFGMIGRFVWQKNHEFLLEVFQNVNKNIPNSKLVLVGDGPLEEKLKLLVSEYEIKDSVLFIKNFDEIEDIYQMLDYFIFPSNYEGLGIVAIEAQIMGLPVLCSDKVPNEVGITDLCHFLDLNLSSQQWADYIISSVMSLRPFERKSRVNEIKQNNYDIRAEAEKLTSIYNELGGKKNYENSIIHR